MVVSRIEITGLWGVKNYDIKLNRDFNFIIGPNGSGKTTILSLVTSILTLDINSINKIDFYECNVDLISDKEEFKLSVLKGEDSNSDSVINYLVSKPGVDEPIISDLFRSRGLRTMDVNNEFHNFRVGRGEYVASESLKNFLSTHVNMTWLPIGRGTSKGFDEGRYSNSVDARLNAVADNFLKYQSYINQTISERMNNFQKDIFLSLIDYSFFEKIKHSPVNFDPKKEKEILSEAFKEIGIKDSQFQKKLNKMFAVISGIEAKSASNDYNMTFDEILWIFNAWKAHYLVEKYNEYKVEKNDINSHVISFIDILNDLFEGRKIFFVSKSNELCSYSPGEYEIKLEDLSSGEKQLIIILGEALLQRGNSCIYIADEPELSLHVTWQEKLVDSIRQINKNSQIIFATHSPDVVSWRQNKTIKVNGG